MQSQLKASICSKNVFASTLSSFHATNTLGFYKFPIFQNWEKHHINMRYKRKSDFQSHFASIVYSYSTSWTSSPFTPFNFSYFCYFSSNFVHRSQPSGATNYWCEAPSVHLSCEWSSWLRGEGRNKWEENNLHAINRKQHHIIGKPG